MDLTVVVTFFPLPQDRGDPIRVLMMLRALARVRPYTLFVVRRPETTAAQVAELCALLPGVTVRDFTPTPYRLNRLGPLGRYQESLLDGMPPWVRTRYSQELHEALHARTGAGLAIGEAAGAYLRDTPLRWHWDKANVLAASSRQDVDEATGMAHHLRAQYLARISTRFEEQSLANCATVSVTSDEEAARLAQAYGRAADFTLPSCVPLPERHTPRPIDRRLVWLSSFSYHSNLLGLHRFLAEGWPQLRRAGYTLELVGSGLTDSLRAGLAEHDGLEVTGWAEDLRPVLARARAAVVPLWSGAGVKLKTLTLLAHSVPVFSTPVGLEGVPQTEGVRSADTAEGLAAAILAAAPAQLDRMAAEALRLIRERFSEAHFADQLVGSLGRHGLLGDAVPQEGP
ncbi:Glycosyl transferases group 1 [Micromonospora viridifaciens]|uniref:Glycosyl transferases group 1 n=1 Tax=Micromonospora viridifaciens TaxID=1881 RepID=A0A1C4ZKU4_MICVI|nr:glycosyltransferase [Micromonospora viridifaciens]SCF33548.1 Glycosyl transferases group 1 [Micromonospora viridifaciens]